MEEEEKETERMEIVEKENIIKVRTRERKA